eukprot:11211464-Lingulodinium_polyedra.AAC.1
MQLRTPNWSLRPQLPSKACSRTTQPLAAASFPTTSSHRPRVSRQSSSFSTLAARCTSFFSVFGPRD